ncbi:hypothetical protein BSL78_24394 [Apostichopus japonicus]|uniref:DHHA2 domain-containing protein n=1 Tax=Stichopus japonicus TaxID=307972 RepID=A0A2G8JSN0_STIJA|nr:hypothetical protein BSL78_24394 [Apostichopus japonicus]
MEGWRKRAERDRYSAGTSRSCTTLVLADILKKSEELLDERIAALAIGTILLDTVNLSTTAGRTTDKDTRVVYTLSRHCPNLLHQEVFDALQKSKFDVTGLSAMDVLRKDFKSVSDQDTTIGLSSIPCSIEVLLDKSEGNQVLQEFCESQRLSVLLLMAAFQGEDGNLKRELGVFSLSQEDEMRAKLTSHLTSDAAGLQLEEQSVDCKDLSSFHHGNVGASRKVVLPLVQKFLEEVGVTNQSTTGDEQKPEDRRADGESSVETEDGGSEMKKSREELTEETPQAEADMSADADQHGAEDKTTDEAREAERGEAEGAEEDDMDNISIKITRKDPPSITPEVQALVDEADGGRGG